MAGCCVPSAARSLRPGGTRAGARAGPRSRGAAPTGLTAARADRARRRSRWRARDAFLLPARRAAVPPARRVSRICRHGAGARVRVSLPPPARLAAARSVPAARRLLRGPGARRGAVLELDVRGGGADVRGAVPGPARRVRAAACRRADALHRAARRSLRRRGGSRAGSLVGGALRRSERAVAALVAPLAGSAFCAVGLLWPGSVCEVPALGVGLFSAAAALEGMS